MRKGSTMPAEQRAKISAALYRYNAERRRVLGLPPPKRRPPGPKRARSGYTLPEEHKAKISASLKGRPKTAEHNRKVAAGVIRYWERQRVLRELSGS